MIYEWDVKKSTTNLRKHSIDFADAITIFEDEYAITIEEEHPDETRYVTIGKDAFERILVVVYMWREENIRVISARKATPRERQQYEK